MFVAAQGDVPVEVHGQDDQRGQSHCHSADGSKQQQPGLQLNIPSQGHSQHTQSTTFIAM